MSEERYEISKLLGKGRTGGVYEAEDTRLGRKVAMRRFFSQTELTDVSEYEEDFISISHSLSALQHPNLLRLYDAGVDEDGAFVISQLVQGDTLHNRLKEGAINTWDVWDMACQMLDALSTAHEGGFVHGAITPGSIMMTPRARGGYLYVILDMGLCRLAPLIQGRDSILSMMADPAILAPELFDGSVEATERSDLYMLGNIIFMCLAGGHPFAARSIEECAGLHQQGLPSITDYADDVPEDFRLWMEQLCRVNPEERPESVVAALQTMPKVEKPAKATQINPGMMGVTTAQLSPQGALTTQPTAQPTAHAPASTLGLGLGSTGPLTANPASNLGTQMGGSLNSRSAAYQKPKKSKKGLVITLCLIAVIGATAAVMMSGDKKPKKTGEQIAKENATETETEAGKDKGESDKAVKKPSETNKPAVAATPAKAELVKGEKIISFSSNGGPPINQGWKLISSKRQGMQKAGWVLQAAKRSVPAMSKRITATDTEDMYKLGWSMDYSTSVAQGSQLVGIHIGADDNEYWGQKGKAVCFLVRLERKGKDLILKDPSSNTNVTIQNGGSIMVNLKFIAKPKDKTGQLSLYINGQHVPDFKGKLSSNVAINKPFHDSLFTTTELATGVWVVKSLSITTGTK